MEKLFRKILVRLGKVIPFVFTFVLSVNYIELVFAVITNYTVETIEGDIIYYTPLSMIIGEVVMIDTFDVVLLYIMGVALRYCKYIFWCIYYMMLNLALRFVMERVLLCEPIIIAICIIMAFLGLFCTSNGFKLIKHKK